MLIAQPDAEAEGVFGRLEQKTECCQSQKRRHEQPHYELLGDRGTGTFIACSTCPLVLESCAPLSKVRALPQGFVEAAEIFQRESGTDPGVDLRAITDRMEIRKAVQSGNVEDAIDRVNDLNPEVCTLALNITAGLCCSFDSPTSRSRAP